MKKTILALSAVLLLAACTPTDPVVTKTGLGTTVNIAASKSVVVSEDGGEDALAQTDITSVALTVDEKGTIISIYVDGVQSKIEFDEKGAIITETDKEFLTKKELGDDYGMRRGSSIDKEWDEQAEAFEIWATGKTVEEVLATPTTEQSEVYTRVPTDPDLVAGCTMDIGDILDATKAAYANAK